MRRKVNSAMRRQRVKVDIGRIFVFEHVIVQTVCIVSVVIIAKIVFDASHSVIVRTVF